MQLRLLKLHSHAVLNAECLFFNLWREHGALYTLQMSCLFNGGPRPSIFELELPFSDICWKEFSLKGSSGSNMEGLGPHCAIENIYTYSPAFIGYLRWSFLYISCVL